VASFKEDTRNTKQEFESLSNSTQILIWSMVAIGVLIGLVLGGAIAYGVSVEEIEGRQCIQYEGDVYCADEEADQLEDEVGDDG
jgi:uncharacterized membrane-anchored protein YhcB (DUF1043 family)